MQERIDLCVKQYELTPNIKIVANITGIKWQTVYWYLKKANIEVKGDKSLYGSVQDKFAHKGEGYVQKILPSAINQNLKQFQPKIDFLVKGYGLEVKSSKLDTKSKRWSFSLKKQKKVADFFILLAFDKEGTDVIHHFMIPSEMLISTLQTISISENIENSKWSDFLVSKEEIIEFFEETINV